jgi:hypothetical protein
MSVSFGRAVSDRCGLAHRFCSEFHTFSIDMLTDGGASRKCATHIVAPHPLGGMKMERISKVL